MSIRSIITVPTLPLAIILAASCDAAINERDTTPAQTASTGFLPSNPERNYCDMLGNTRAICSSSSSTSLDPASSDQASSEVTSGDFSSPPQEARPTSQPSEPLETQLDTDAGSSSADPVDDTAQPLLARTDGVYAHVYSTSAIELFWDNPGGDGSVDHHEIFRDGSYLGSTRGTSHFDSGLLAGTRYAYAIDTVFSSGERHAGTELVVLTLADDWVTPMSASSSFSSSSTSASSQSLLSEAELGVTVDGASVRLEWTAQPRDGVIEGFDVFRDDDFLRRTTALHLSDPLPAPGQTRRYEVEAVLDIGREQVGVVTVGGRDAGVRWHSDRRPRWR